MGGSFSLDEIHFLYTHVRHSCHGTCLVVITVALSGTELHRGIGGQIVAQVITVDAANRFLTAQRAAFGSNPLFLAPVAVRDALIHLLVDADIQVGSRTSVAEGGLVAHP